MFELIFNAVLALVFVFFITFGMQIPHMSSPGDLVEAGGFPIIFAAVGLVLLVAETVDQFRKVKSRKGQNQGEFDFSKLYKVLVIIGMTIIYIAFVKYAGFLILSAVFTFVSLNLLGSQKQVFNVVFTCITVIALVLIFGRFFGVSLPRGTGIIKELSFYLY